VRRSGGSKEVTASVGSTYRVDADFEKIKEYYLSTLERLSWQRGEERELKDWDGSFLAYEFSFSKGEFYVKLEYRGDKSVYGWDYGLSVGWRYKKT